MQVVHKLSGRHLGAPLCAILLLVGAAPGRLEAADPAFVGSLAMLAEDEVVRKLELTRQQQDQILRLIERREAAALELAMAARQLSAAEKEARQAEFVAESEQEGMKILTEVQRERLAKLQLSREGLAALARPDVAEQLGLSDEQRQQVSMTLKARAAALAKTEEGKRDIAIAVYDKRLQKVLTDDQQAQWEAMTELSAPATAQASTGAPSGGPQQGLPADADGRLRFNFRYAPWKDVLDWFATQADLSLVLDAPPPGTFNYTDSRTYSAEEAIDVLNSVLLTKGYTLVRRERMLLLINLEDGIPPNLVTTVPLQELDLRGDFELVSTLFRLGGITPEDAEQEITKLLGPQGSMQVLPKAKQVFVTETAGRLRTIRDVLRAMEDPDGIQAGRVTTFELQHVLPDDVFEVVRQMLGLPEGQNAAADGSIRMATDVSGQRIMVSGQPELVQQVGQLIKLVDVPMPMFGRPGSVTEAPQLEVYPVIGADPESALLVLQTLLADEDVRLATDPKTGSVVALGLPAHHATIRATLEQMRTGGQEIDVVQLQVLDPQVALLAINRLFGVGEEGNTSAPKVEADLTTKQLMIRATQGQIEQIRTLLEKLGETPGAALALHDQASSRSVRVLPMAGADAQAVLEQIQQIWPTMRPNRIRTVTPSAVIRSISPRSSSTQPPAADERAIDRRRPPRRDPASTAPAARYPRREQSTIDPRRRDDAESDRTQRAPEAPATGVGQAAQELNATRFVAAADAAELLAQAPAREPLIDRQAPADPSEDPQDPRAAGTRDTDDGSAPADDVPGADIVIAVSPNGLIIASKDREALNDFEDLLRQLAASETGGARDFAVFYLRHATAESATQILNNILSGGTVGSSDDDGGLLGGLAGAALGDVGGGLMGSLLGLGGSSSFQASGTYSIVPEPRLNMLVVQANAADMKLIEQLLEIVDQRASPELVQTIPAPRMIPVYYTSADQVAEVVRQVFASQLASGPGQQRQPSPEDFIRALRGGGRGGRGGDRDGGVEEQRQLTVGVDTRGNQLVVGAPDDLFYQIEALVRELDQEDSDSHEMTRVVTLDRVNPEMVRRALASIVGQPQPTPSGQSTNGAAQPTGTRGERVQGGRGDGGGRGDRGGENNVRQQVEMFRALQQRAGGGDRGGRGGEGARGGGNRGGNRGGGNRGGFGAFGGRNGNRGR